jgi:hypothetical protein
MTDVALANTGVAVPRRPSGWRGIVADWSSDQRAFKNNLWGKAMMWIFLLVTPSSSGFLLSHDSCACRRGSPNQPKQSLRFDDRQYDHPLILIAIMTFILISSGTMAWLLISATADRVKARPYAGDRGIGRHIRRNAGLEWTADYGRRAPWATRGRGPVWLQLFMITASRYPRDRGSSRSSLRKCCAELRPRCEALQAGRGAESGNHGPVLTFVDPLVGVHPCPLLFW